MSVSKNSVSKTDPKTDPKTDLDLKELNLIKMESEKILKDIERRESLFNLEG